MTIDRVIEMIEGLVGRTISEKDAEEMVELVMEELSVACQNCGRDLDFDEVQTICGGCAIDAGIDPREVPE